MTVFQDFSPGGQYAYMDMGLDGKAVKSLVYVRGYGEKAYVQPVALRTEIQVSLDTQVNRTTYSDVQANRSMSGDMAYGYRQLKNKDVAWGTIGSARTWRQVDDEGAQWIGLDDAVLYALGERFTGPWTGGGE